MNQTLTETSSSLSYSEDGSHLGQPLERRTWIEQQRRLIESEMRALWFSTGFTVIGLFVAVALLYINRL